MSTGCSSLQPPHQDAQKLSSQTLPLRSFDEITFSGSWSCCSENSGAAFPTKGRRQFARVERQPNRKKTDHDDEEPERDEKPVHETVGRAIWAVAGTAASFRRQASR